MSLHHHEEQRQQRLQESWSQNNNNNNLGRKSHNKGRASLRISLFSLGVVDLNDDDDDDDDGSSSTSSVETSRSGNDIQTNKRYSVIVKDLHQAISMVESSFEQQQSGGDDDDVEHDDESDTSSINAEMRHLESVQDLRLELEQADQNFHHAIENSYVDDDDADQSKSSFMGLIKSNPWWPSSPIRTDERVSIKQQLHRKTSNTGKNSCETTPVDRLWWERDDLDDPTMESPPVPFLELILQHYRTTQHPNQQCLQQSPRPFHQWMDWRFIMNLATLQLHSLNIAMTTTTRRKRRTKMITLRHSDWWSPLPMWFREILTPPAEDRIHLYRLAIVMGSLDVSRRHQNQWHVILLHDTLGRAMRQQQQQDQQQEKIRSSSHNNARNHHGIHGERIEL
jgi:hypothetical protein